MTSDYTKWYRAGDITANKNSNAVIGHNTRWADVNIKPGDMFSVDSITEYEVDQVIDNTNLTLKTPYTGESVDHVNYRIIRNWTANSSADIAAQNTEMLEIFRKYFNDDINTLQGESAYDIAVKNGFVGTESQWLESLSAYGQAKKNGYTGTLAEWLESLKAAGEWSNASGRLASLESRLAPFPIIPENDGIKRLQHNLYPRFKDLGTTVTSAQYEALNNRTFDDLYIGDFWRWTINGREIYAYIIQLGGMSYENVRGSDAYPWSGTTSPYYTRCAHLAIMYPNTEKYVMNDEATTEGGYLASKMHTQTMPALAAELEEFLGAEHLDNYSQFVCSSNVYDEYGQLLKFAPNEFIVSKLELFQFNDVFNIVNYYGPNMADMLGCTPFALFQKVPFSLLGSQYGCVLHRQFYTFFQEPPNSPKNATNFLYINQQYTHSILANTEAQVIAHAVLIP